MAADRTSFSAQVNSIAGGTKGPSDSDSSELVALVDELLNNLSKKFDGVSSEILSKMDEMSKRIDALEANILAGSTQDEGNSQAEGK